MQVVWSKLNEQLAAASLAGMTNLRSVSILQDAPASLSSKKASSVVADALANSVGDVLALELFVCCLRSLLGY